MVEGASAEERRPPLEGWEAGMMGIRPGDGWLRAHTKLVAAERGEAEGETGRRSEMQKDVEDNNGCECNRTVCAQGPAPVLSQVSLQPVILMPSLFREMMNGQVFISR